MPINGDRDDPANGWSATLNVEPPRALTTAEHLVLGLLLSLDFPGAESLREQARSALVDGGCACGCPSIGLRVAPDAPLASGLTSRLIPSEGIVEPVADEVPGQIILFVDAGRLTYLEYVFFDEPPTDWPPPERIRVVATPRK